MAQGFRFFVAAVPRNLARFDLTPFGLPLEPLPFPGDERHARRTDALIRLFHSLDTHMFGARGLTMPRWVLVNHALVSSGLVLVTCPADELDSVARTIELKAYQRVVLDELASEAAAAGFTGPIPVAGYCAAPTVDQGRMTGWSLCSAVPTLGLGFVAKALALACYRAKLLCGITQYDNIALRTHTRFGPARVQAAVVHLHTAPGSLIYETDFERWHSRAVDSDPMPDPTWFVSVRDTSRHNELQEMINARSQTITILPPGIVIHDEKRLVPILVSDYVAGPDQR